MEGSLAGPINQLIFKKFDSSFYDKLKSSLSYVGNTIKKLYSSSKKKETPSLDSSFIKNNNNNSSNDDISFGAQTYSSSKNHFLDTLNNKKNNASFHTFKEFNIEDAFHTQKTNNNHNTNHFIFSHKKENKENTLERNFSQDNQTKHFDISRMYISSDKNNISSKNNINNIDDSLSEFFINNDSNILNSKIENEKGNNNFRSFIDENKKESEEIKNSMNNSNIINSESVDRILGKKRKRFTDSYGLISADFSKYKENNMPSSSQSELEKMNREYERKRKESIMKIKKSENNFYQHEADLVIEYTNKKKKIIDNYSAINAKMKALIHQKEKDKYDKIILDIKK